MERSYLVLDIETILDPGLPLAEPSESEGLPAPPHHEIVCIGVLWFGADLVVKRIGIIGDDKDEPGVLADFARFLDRHKPTLVTFNGRGFDLPVIAARSMKHGQPLNYYYRDRDVRYRFSAEGHLDLLDFLLSLVKCVGSWSGQPSTGSPAASEWHSMTLSQTQL